MSVLFVPSPDERAVLHDALSAETFAARRECLALYLAQNGAGAALDLFAGLIGAVRHSTDLSTAISAIALEPAVAPVVRPLGGHDIDMETTDCASVERFVGILEAWGQNSADLDFFAGDVIDMVLSDCDRAARLIRHLINERRPRSEPRPESG